MALTPSTEQNDNDKHAGASFRPAQSNCTRTDLDFARKKCEFHQNRSSSCGAPLFHKQEKTTKLLASLQVSQSSGLNQSNREIHWRNPHPEPKSLRRQMVDTFASIVALHN